MNERTSYIVHVHFIGKDAIRRRRSFLVANALSSQFAVKSVFSGGEGRDLNELEVFKVDVQMDQYSRVVELK